MKYCHEILENGITLKVNAMPTTCMVTLLLRLKGGMAWEKLCQNGITHLVEHLCFRRSNSNAQEDFYFKIGSTGGVLRGTTYRDCVVFEITVNKKYFCQAVEILQELFLENKWTHDDIRREKEVVYRQIETSVFSCYHQLIYKFFEELPQGEFISGTKNKVKRLSLPQLICWKNDLFCTHHTFITVAGNINSNDFDFLKNIFSSLEKSQYKVYPDIKPKSFLKRESAIDKYYTGNNSYVQIGISFDINVSTINEIKAEILHNTLCGELYSPFNLRLREELGLLHEIDSGVNFYSFGGILYFIFEVHKEKTAQLMDEITQLFAAQKSCLDKRAFDCVYTSMTDGKEGILNQSQEVAYLEFDSEFTTLQNYANRYKSISYEDIQKACNEILCCKNMLCIFWNMPDDEELSANLYDKKEILRKELGV